MSRAFVKEDDNRVDNVPERLHSPHPNLVTPEGLAALRRQVATLEVSRRCHAAAQGLPDRQALAMVERDIRYVEERIARAIPVDLAAQPRDRVGFGARVETEDAAGIVRRFQIVGEDEADPAAGKLSWISPLARALRDARIGETVVWKKPSGDLTLDILSISYPGC